MEANETPEKINNTFSKTQTYLNKTSRTQDSKQKKQGIKLPKLSNNTFYGSSQTSGEILIQKNKNQNLNNNNNIIINNSYYEKINLKQELSQYKSELNSKKSELQELKIKFNKLNEDNKMNKLLLAKILDIDLEKEFTREEVLNKLEYCTLNDTEKKILKEAHEIIQLKLDLEEKKKKINLQLEEEENLTKNAKSKIIN